MLGCTEKLSQVNVIFGNKRFRSGRISCISQGAIEFLISLLPQDLNSYLEMVAEVHETLSIEVNV